MKELACKPGRNQIRTLQFLAGSYYYGTGVDKDAKEAARYWKKAAELGDAESQHLLGLCYRNGEGVEKDLEAFGMWCGKAAAQGYAAAQSNLGAAFSQGAGVKQSRNSCELVLQSGSTRLCIGPVQPR